MKKNILLWMIGACFFIGDICLAQVPHQVGGFVLGKDIADYKEMVRMETSLPIRHMEYLKEVEIKEMEGFKSGLICYGTCEVPGRIVRIKLKYADSTKKFYEALLERFKERFGEPTEWRGDPFKIVIAWKWSLTDSENNKISLTLQHNTKDVEEKMGNSVKLTISNFMEEEHLCFEKRHLETRKRPGKQEAKARGKVDWDRFVPR
ncbi:MAG: hypothetical protein JSW12_12000 [Deltaproteobacteria bacterium]|nr:MAG: hypothetical protein JSW12_12000 [Deltaproteobacteria bacterium]